MTTVVVQTRKHRRTVAGVVASHGRDKTIKVHLERLVKMPKYGKYLRRRTVVHVHDEKNEAKTGDRVEVTECRPISKTKAWRLVRILNRAPREARA